MNSNEDNKLSEDRLVPIEATLESEGLFFTREDDAEAFRVSFKSEGDRYFIVSYRDDAEFLMLGSGWSLGPNVDIARALEIANRNNARKKFVKTAIWPDERDVLFTVELCYANYDDFSEHFVRLLGALRECAADFFNSLRD